MLTTKQAPGLFRVRIASGEHRGFFVGPNIPEPLSQQTAEEERALSLPGFSYVLCTQESAALCFGSAVALEVQADLWSRGVDSELI